MWQTPTQEVIRDNDQYIGVDGTTYPWNFPKDEILYPEGHPKEGQLQLTFLPQNVQTDDEKVAALAGLKIERWNRIKLERDRRQELGVFAAGNWFNSDSKSRIQQIGLNMMGARIPDGLQWKTLDNVFVLMTPTLASEIFNATANSDVAIFAAAEVHRTAMLAATDPALYDFSTGWPAAYGG